MTALREDWQVLLGLFPSDWEELGRSSGAVTRLRGFDSLNDLLRTLLLHVGCGWSLRETAVSVMDLFLSSQNQRLNEVMKVLTVIATLFIPLTTIASIYGMNFKHMPELEWRYGYAYALGLMLLVAGIMVGYFKKRGWW